MSVRSFEPEMENWMATVVQELPFNLRSDGDCASHGWPQAVQRQNSVSPPSTRTGALQQRLRS
jgi:hypothetical protein